MSTSGIRSSDGSVKITGGGATVDLSVSASIGVTMNGDVIGTTLASTVVAIQGYSVVATVPSSGQVLVASGGSWTPMSIPLGISAGTGIGVAAVSGIFTISNTGVLSVAAGDSSVTIGGTAANPTIVTGRLDQIAAAHPTGANWSNNGFKITGLANGTAASDAAAFGQIPLSGSTVVGPDAFGASPSAGSAATWSRSDHDHGLPANPLLAWNGWIAESHTWTYSSTDTHTYVVTVNADITGYIGLGTKIKLTNQSATQYFFVTAISVTSGTTTVTLYGGTGSSLTNTAITNPAYSFGKPQGFPLDPASWTETFTDTVNRTKSGPTGGTWEWSSLGSPALVVPIGIWWIRYFVIAVISTGGATAVGVSMLSTLSTTTNSQTDATMTDQTFENANLVTAQEQSIVAGLGKQRSINLSSKTTYNLLGQSQGTLASGSIEFANANATGYISATSAYL